MIKKCLTAALSTIVVLSLSGCFLPEPPGAGVVASVRPVDDGIVQFKMSRYWDRVDPQRFPIGGTGNVTWKYRYAHRRLLFAATDQHMQDYFGKAIQSAYQNRGDVRWEDAAWWFLSPLIRDLYDEVLYIPWNRLNSKTLVQSLKQLESQGEPFDAMILTSGIPNHLIASPKQGLIPPQEIEALTGALPHLNLVFLGACYGDTLAARWIGAGAKGVLAYHDQYFNPIYLEVLLKELAKSPSNSRGAYERANARYPRAMREGIFHQQLMDRIYQITMQDAPPEERVSKEAYFSSFPPPSLFLPPP